MQVALLNTTNPAYDAEYWRDLWALYEGGQSFRARMQRMLVRNAQEPDAVYAERCKVAHYRDYLGPIVDYFVAFLFTAHLAYRAKREGTAVDPDEWYGLWKEDCDGCGTDLVEFLRERMTRALVEQKAYWIIEPQTDGGPAPQSRQEWADRGLGEMRLRAINREQILDKSKGEDGALDWIIVYGCETPRTLPTSPRDMILHRWWIYTRETVELFEYRQKQGEPIDAEAQATSIGGPQPHGFDRVPVVELSVPVGLWVANRVESPQREHFALSNAHTWLIRRTCYAMPIFRLTDREVPPKMGTGYYMMIGKDETMEWSSPEGTPFEMIRAEVASQKDEIFRIIHQMALGVENNAAAVGRSALSKHEDSNATKVILTAYGACVRKAVEQTYQFIGAARDDGIEWSIEGLDKYSTDDALQLVQAISQAIMLDIPSPTWHKEALTQAALVTMPGLDQQRKDDIRAEIEKNFVEETVLAAPPGPGKPKPGEDDDEQDEQEETDKTKTDAAAE